MIQNYLKINFINFSLLFTVICFMSATTNLSAEGTTSVECMYINKTNINDLTPGIPEILEIKQDTKLQDGCCETGTRSGYEKENLPSKCLKCTVQRCIANIACIYNGILLKIENTICGGAYIGNTCPTNAIDCVIDGEEHHDNLKRDSKIQSYHNVFRIENVSRINFKKLYPKYTEEDRFIQDNEDISKDSGSVR